MKMKKILSALILGLVIAPLSLGASSMVVMLTLLFGGGVSAMTFAGVIDASLLTLDRDGIAAISELIFTDKFSSPKWSEFCSLETGIKANKQIAYGGHFNGLSGSVRANCDITANPYSVAMSEKTWQPKYVSDRFEDCFDNINASTFWKKFLGNGISKENLTQSAFDAYVKSRISEFMDDDLFYRLLFFTNTAIAAGGTNNLAPDELKYFNMFNGILPQLATIYGTTAARRNTITENGNATYALQNFTATTITNQVTTGYLNAVVYGATMDLRGKTDGIIIVSQTIMDSYVRERKAVANIEEAYKRTESGMQTVMFDGKQMIAIPTYDRLVQRHFDNGNKWLNPHFILYPSKGNIKVGTEEESNFSELNSEYNSYFKKAFWEYGFNMDVKIIDDSQVQVGI